MQHPQNFAFLLTIAGILLLYVEALHIGKIIFGFTGVALILLGMRLFATLPYHLHAPAPLAASVLCFAVEARWNTRCLAGGAATVLFAMGFRQLCLAEPISPLLLVPVSALFGVLTTALVSMARRARRNKAEL